MKLTVKSAFSIMNSTAIWSEFCRNDKSCKHLNRIAMQVACIFICMEYKCMECHHSNEYSFQGNNAYAIFNENFDTGF